MKLILQYLKPHAKAITACCFLLLVSTVCELFLPKFMSDIVRDGINKLDMQVVAIKSALMLAISVVSIISLIIFAKINAKLSSSFTAQLKLDIFKKANSLSYSDFNKIGASALLTRTTEDIEMLGEFVPMMIRCVVTIPVLLIGGTVLSLLEDVVLSLCFFAFVPIMLVFVIVLGSKLFMFWEVSDKYIDIQNQLVRDRLTGIRVIRAFNKEDVEHKKIEKTTVTMANYIITANVRGSLVYPISLMILNFVTVLIIYIGAMRMQATSLVDASGVIAVLQYVSLIMSAIMTFSFAIVFWPKVKVSANRIGEVTDHPDAPMVDDSFIERLTGDIDFVDVGFKYEGAELAALKNVNLSIREGETVALIGGTGSGKSTILQLLLHFFEATEGEIRICGVPIDKLSDAKIRDAFSVSLQKARIFRGTIRDNVAMGKIGATDEEILSALKVAQMDKFVAENGLDYRVEQNGANLSGGQKQRIAIARAVIRNAAVFVFDDTFSALDYLTESKLRKALNAKIKGKTQLIITQRIATVMGSDRIYVLDKGEIVGSGTHSELLKTCGVYREIYASQVGGAR